MYFNKTWHTVRYIVSIQNWLTFLTSTSGKGPPFDLDLDSTRIQVDALAHTLTPFWSVLSCHSCFLPGDFHPWQVLVDGSPPVFTRTTWTPLEPQNLPVQRLSRYTLVIHSYHMSKPTESFHWVCYPCPLLTLTYSFVMSFLEMPKMLLCHLWWAGQRSAFSLVLLLVAIPLHCTEGLIGLLLRTTLSSPLG